MTGARTREMMTENLKTLKMEPLSDEEMQRIRKIGDYIYGKPRK
jgi:aryl-alcohol dehydrogenase-like predicted oxidoreductase